MRTPSTLGSSKVIVAYVFLSAVWIVVSIPLLVVLKHQIITLFSLGVLYIASLVLILYLVSQRKHAATKSLLEYDLLLHSLLEPVMIHANGVILRVNAHAANLFGADEQELIGEPIWKFVHEESQNLAAERIGRLRQGESTRPIREKFLTLSGEILEVEVTGIPIRFQGTPAILIIIRNLTERVQYQNALQESERRLRTLIDALPDQICLLDNHERWLEANRALLDAVGLSTLYRGKTAQELADFCSLQFRDDFIHNSKYTPEVYDSMTHFDHEYVLTDGTVSAHKVTRVPIKGEDGRHEGLVVIARDVSEERAARKRLHESEQRYRSLFENDGDMVLSVDIHGIITSANPATLTLFGYVPDSLIGRLYGELMTRDHHTDPYSRFLRLLDGETQTAFVTVRHADGTLSEAYEKQVPIMIEGHLSGFFCIIRDVETLRRAEELAIQSERLSAIGQLAAGIAHEIRNPLTVLKGFLQLMKPSETTPERYLTVMKDEFIRIESILDELLVMAKPTTRKLEEYSCAELVNDTIQFMNPEALLRDISVSSRIQDASLGILCEKNRIKQVMVNLIKNAFEAMPDGGSIEVTVAAETEKLISISVSDNGPGIPPDVLSRIGEPFYTTKTKGTGLGLMVCRQIAEAHDGMLNIRSELGQGTTVELILPRLGTDSEASFRLPYEDSV